MGFLNHIREGKNLIQSAAPDRNWRDAYDDEAHPSEEADEALDEEGYRD